RRCAGGGRAAALEGCRGSQGLSQRAKRLRAEITLQRDVGAGLPWNAGSQGDFDVADAGRLEGGTGGRSFADGAGSLDFEAGRRIDEIAGGIDVECAGARVQVLGSVVGDEKPLPLKGHIQ